MIFHNCIKCDYFEMIPMADKTPAFEKYECPECNTTQWIKHSRLQPETYSEDMIEVDEEDRSVTIKPIQSRKRR